MTDYAEIGHKLARKMIEPLRVCSLFKGPPLVDIFRDPLEKIDMIKTSLYSVYM